MTTYTGSANVRTRPLDGPVQVPFWAAASNAPASGDTVILPNDNRNMMVWLEPAAGLAALTVQLPLDVSTEVGQSIVIRSSQTITTLTIAAAAADGATTIYAPTNIAAGIPVTIQKQATKKWG